MPRLALRSDNAIINSAGIKVRYLFFFFYEEKWKIRLIKRHVMLNIEMSRVYKSM